MKKLTVNVKGGFPIEFDVSGVTNPEHIIRYYIDKIGTLTIEEFFSVEKTYKDFGKAIPKKGIKKFLPWVESEYETVQTTYSSTESIVMMVFAHGEWLSVEPHEEPSDS